MEISPEVIYIYIVPISELRTIANVHSTAFIYVSRIICFRCATKRILADSRFYVALT